MSSTPWPFTERRPSVMSGKSVLHSQRVRLSVASSVDYLKPRTKGGIVIDPKPQESTAKFQALKQAVI